MKEMVIKGLGVGWLPFSMVHKEIENGDLISLSQHFGQENLNVTIHANRKDEMAIHLFELWSQTK